MTVREEAIQHLLPKINRIYKHAVMYLLPANQAWEQECQLLKEAPTFTPASIPVVETLKSR